MVTGPKALADLLWGNQGAAQALAADKVFINMSTVSPRFTREMVQRLLPAGAAVIDAPVSGSKMAAEEGSLLVLAGGDREQVATMTPLFETFAKKVVYCGDVGSGSMMKITINFLLASMMEGLAEALNFGKHGGLSAGAILEVIQAGPLGCSLFGNKATMILENDFPVNFPLKQMTKELKFMLDTAYDTGANVPTGSTLLQLYRLGVSQGWGDLDFSGIVKVLEYLSGRE
jgi:3-hydroxyisobutyrate dehydrogenase-like beta-hydroxyacid dehydrogenase